MERINRKEKEDKKNVADEIEFNTKKISTGDEIIDLLELKEMDRNGRFIFHRLAFEQNNETLTNLIQLIPKKPEFEQIIMHVINYPDAYGNTCLILACVKNERTSDSRFKVLSTLIEAGADINRRNDTTFWTALHWCAHWGDSKSIELLLKNNAFAFLPSKEGVYPVDLAGTKRFKESVKLLNSNIISLLNLVGDYSEQELLNLVAHEPYRILTS